jgi:CBS domain-containing protein
MNGHSDRRAFHPMTLHATTAADVMTPNPLSVCDTLSVQEAIVFLTERKIGGAPVINDAGRPVGVVTEADILRHDRTKATRLMPVGNEAYGHEFDLPSGEHLDVEGFEIEVPDDTTVGEIMNPLVLAVRPETPIHEVVKQLVKRRIHRLFVVDRTESLVGVITSLDILQRMSNDES